MTEFARHCRDQNVLTLAAFGDSITAGAAASAESMRWTNRLAVLVGARRLRNQGIGGTVLQCSPLADGARRPDHGRGRFEQALLGANRADAIAILYGFNDARYAAAPTTFNLEGFIRDYREVLAGLLAAGYAADAICLGSPPHLPAIGLRTGSAGFTGQTRERFEAFVPAVRDLAAEAGVFYAPVNERMQAEGGDALVFDDHIHPNDAGHRVIAASFAEACRAAAS